MNDERGSDDETRDLSLYVVSEQHPFWKNWLLLYWVSSLTAIVMGSIFRTPNLPQVRYLTLGGLVGG